MLFILVIFAGELVVCFGVPVGRSVVYPGDPCRQKCCLSWVSLQAEVLVYLGDRCR